MCETDNNALRCTDLVTNTKSANMPGVVDVFTPTGPVANAIVFETDNGASSWLIT